MPEYFQTFIKLFLSRKVAGTWGLWICNSLSNACLELVARVGIDHVRLSNSLIFAVLTQISSYIAYCYIAYCFMSVGYAVTGTFAGSFKKGRYTANQ